jgi:hypothetical protein
VESSIEVGRALLTGGRSPPRKRSRLSDEPPFLTLGTRSEKREDAKKNSRESNSVVTLFFFFFASSCLRVKSAAVAKPVQEFPLPTAGQTATIFAEVFRWQIAYEDKENANVQLPTFNFQHRPKMDECGFLLLRR